MGKQDIKIIFVLNITIFARFMKLLAYGYC